MRMILAASLVVPPHLAFAAGSAACGCALSSAVLTGKTHTN
jgi:hypothetical protein